VSLGIADGIARAKDGGTGALGTSVGLFGSTALITHGAFGFFHHIPMQVSANVVQTETTDCCGLLCDAAGGGVAALAASNELSPPATP
jgi:hypothetical protein